MANYVQLCSTRGEHGNNPGLLMIPVSVQSLPLAILLLATLPALAVTIPWPALIILLLLLPGPLSAVMSLSLSK
jgi:hypothetical protein